MKDIAGHTERFTHRVHSRSKLTLTGFQHIVLPLWSTVDALMDTDSVVRSTTIGVLKTASEASYCSQSLLPIMMIAAAAVTEM